MMGAGKTSVGREVAACLGVPFVDLDVRVERVFGVSISEVFAHSEDHFRALEREALRSLLAEPAFARNRVVVATGGGVVVDPHNRARMDAAGVRMLIHVPPEQLAARLVGAEARHRPLVADATDAVARLRELWETRRQAYEGGAIIIDGVGTIPVVAARVLQALDLTP